MVDDSDQHSFRFLQRLIVMHFADSFRLSRREYYLDFFITPPLTLALAFHSLRGAGASPVWLCEFACGLLAWTLYEYALHRFVLHGMPFGRDVHALHHKNQLDYIAQPPWATLAVYALSWAIFGPSSSAFMVGMSAGYCAYAAAHTLFHYARFTPGSWLWRLDQRHARHHARGDVCYGVTVDWWDRAFGTEAAA
jgi:sterol desaturase/sphingolipid hydroxylase (fatty acid hydroxylase superfamily)